MIELKFSTSTSGLAGFDLGKETYEQQIESKYENYNEKLTLKFPDYVERVASSFVQGLFSELVNNIGYSGVKENVIIESKSEKLKNTIWDRLY